MHYILDEMKFTLRIPENSRGKQYLAHLPYDIAMLAKMEFYDGEYPELLDKESNAPGKVRITIDDPHAAKAVAKILKKQLPVLQHKEELSQDLYNFVRSEHQLTFKTVTIDVAEDFEEGLRLTDGGFISFFGNEQRIKTYLEGVLKEWEDKRDASSWDKANNLRLSGIKLAQAAMKGKRIKAPKKLKELRLKVCKKCPFYRPDAKVTMFGVTVPGKTAAACGDCGCILNKKAALYSETCRQGKWDVIQEIKKNG